VSTGEALGMVGRQSAHSSGPTTVGWKRGSVAVVFYGEGGGGAPMASDEVLTVL
jgi:hypothetical protein